MSERYSLLGGAYKRLAKILEEREQVRKAIRDAAASYGKAAEHEVRRGKFDHYAVVNRLALLVLLDETPGDWEELLRQSQQNARERFLSERGTKDAVFHALAPADIAVVRALASKSLDVEGPERDRAIDDIVALHGETRRVVDMSPRQMNSVVNQLNSLRTFIEKLEGSSPDPAATLRRDALGKIAASLSG
jgi:Tetratricopeptide Repeats-Sensor